VIRSAVATRLDSFTIDEHYHITAGVSYARLGDYRLNPEHPPGVYLCSLDHRVGPPAYRFLSDGAQKEEPPAKSAQSVVGTSRQNGPRGYVL
jgi:hypothetical protein